MRASLLLILCASLLAATCGESKPTGPLKRPTIELSPAQVPDDLGQRAYQHVAQLCDFGERYSGSPGWQLSLDYIAHHLRINTGREPVRDRWTDPDFGVTFENIHVTLPGRSDDRIVIGCHHDTKKFKGPNPEDDFFFVGANDSGSGVGLLLELATLIAQRENEATYQIVFFDGEESLDIAWNNAKSLFGSRRFVEQNRERLATPGDHYELSCLVLLDMIGRRGALIDEELNSDESLRTIFWSAASAAGHRNRFFRESHHITDDHMPFLAAGIPAIDLIDYVGNDEWHTPDDTLEHIDAASLHMVGEVVMTALPGIEDTYMPPDGNLQLPGGR